MSTIGRPNTRPERPVRPDLKERFDEDPARFLNKPPEMAVCRIRGIRDPELLDAYLEVEADVYGPRRPVVAAINQRKAELRERGAR